MTNPRAELLWELIELRRPLPAILKDLSTLPWDCEETLVTIKTEHVVAILERYMSGNLASSTVEEWADAVELRDGIGFDPNSRVAEAIYELANPLITQPLSVHSASSLVASLGGAAT